MKAIWRGEDNELGLRNGKEYEILGRDADFPDMFGVYTESGGPYIYPAEDFEITEDDPSSLNNLEVNTGEEKALMEHDTMTEIELAVLLDTMAENIEANATTVEEAAEILRRKARFLKDNPV